MGAKREEKIIFRQPSEPDTHSPKRPTTILSTRFGVAMCRMCCIHNLNLSAVLIKSTRKFSSFSFHHQVLLHFQFLRCRHDDAWRHVF